MATAKPVITLSVMRRGSTIFTQTYRGESLVAGRAHECQLVLDDHYIRRG